MSQANIKNELIKRKYFKFLQEAEGLCSNTIDKMNDAICLYEEFTVHKDLNSFNSNKAIDYKSWLQKREFRGKPISVTTIFAYLRHLRKFLTWLSGQKGYKERINHNSIMYLKISKKEEKVATQYIPRKFPAFEDVIKVVNSIKIENEIDQRDKALISFTALTGMRDQAIITLPIGCFDTKRLIINQDPRSGVQTKFSKHIISVVFRFDDNLFQYIMDWVEYLKNKKFSPNDPLFPRNKVKQEGNNLSFETSDSVEPVFWKGTGRIREIFKRRFEEAGLSYYPPHTFRHMAIELALKRCKTAEQVKAVSQNFGHDKVATTFGSYANWEPQKLAEILTNINFSGKPLDIGNNKREKIKESVLNALNDALNQNLKGLE